MGRVLTSRLGLAALAFITIALHIAIHTSKQGLGGELLDFRLTGEGARALTEALCTRPGATGSHLWITIWLDTPYAMAYGLLVAGLCARYAPRWPVLFAAPALIAASCDLLENVVQILALTSTADLLATKTLLTPAKFALIAPASALALWLWARRVL